MFLNCVCIASGCLFGELAEQNICLQLGVALLQESQWADVLFAFVWDDLGMLGQLLGSGNPTLGTLTGLILQRAGS